VFNRDVHDNPRLIDDILWISVTAELSIDIANVTWAFKGNDTYAVTYTPLTTGAVIVVRSVVMLFVSISGVFVRNQVVGCSSAWGQHIWVTVSSRCVLKQYHTHQR
jgi:hypothetical protein